jgi:hypothetical protein
MDLDGSSREVSQKAKMKLGARAIRLIKKWKAWVWGNRYKDKRRQRGRNIIPAPVSSLLDAPTRRDDGNDCAF